MKVASCIENVSSEVLRDVFLAVPAKVVDMFNTAIIPDSWKIAQVTPLQKPGNKSMVSNLRPISILPLTSKLIEKIVHNRIYNFCETNKILDPKQGGFRPGHSTISTTSLFLNDIYNAMNNTQITYAVFIDAMKAFDTVNHEILLKKNHKIGIRGNLGSWLKNYLTNRKQCTQANGTVSELTNLTYGVPQGSVCGPLLFLIYINDLSKSLKYSKVSLYADDTVIYTSHNNKDEALRLIQKDLNLLQRWCCMNKLTINCKKNKYCVFGMSFAVKKSKATNDILSLNNQILNRVCSYKYFGFTLDEHLNFNKHIEELKNLVSHKLYLLSKIRKYITTEACILIFKTMILSLIEYGSIIYRGTNIANITKFKRLFYRGLRICTNSQQHETKRNLCTYCNIATPDVRYNCQLLLYMHKQTDNNVLLKKPTRQTRLHAAPVFNTYKPNNEKAKANVIYRGALAWNALSANDRNLDFVEFKALQKKHVKLSI